jgi:hypothetical protein
MSLPGLFTFPVTGPGKRCSTTPNGAGRSVQVQAIPIPVGPLLENFAIGEVARQLTWAEEPVQLYRLGDRFRAGIVLYAGEQQLSFGGRLIALPMAALWMLDSRLPEQLQGSLLGAWTGDRARWRDRAWSGHAARQRARVGDR